MLRWMRCGKAILFYAMITLVISASMNDLDFLVHTWGYEWVEFFGRLLRIFFFAVCFTAGWCAFGLQCAGHPLFADGRLSPQARRAALPMLWQVLVFFAGFLVLQYGTHRLIQMTLLGSAVELIGPIAWIFYKVLGVLRVPQALFGLTAVCMAADGDGVAESLRRAWDFCLRNWQGVLLASVGIYLGALLVSGVPIFFDWLKELISGPSLASQLTPGLLGLPDELFAQRVQMVVIPSRWAVYVLGMAAVAQLIARERGLNAQIDRGAVRETAKVLALTVVTCGFYALYWVYDSTTKINRACAPAPPKRTWVCVLLIFFFGEIYMPIWMYGQGRRLESVARRKGIRLCGSPWEYVFWMFLMPTAVFFGLLLSRCNNHMYRASNLITVGILVMTVMVYYLFINRMRQVLFAPEPQWEDEGI